MKNIKYNIQELYLKGRCYLYFMIFQITITILIVLYIFSCFEHFNQKLVFSLELFVVFFMILDMFFYYQINQKRIGLVNILEFLIVGAYVSLFFYIGYRVNSQDEELELSLVVFRLILQLLRITVGVIKIGENQYKRTSISSEIKITTGQMNSDKSDQNSEYHKNDTEEIRLNNVDFAN